MAADCLTLVSDSGNRPKCTSQAECRVVEPDDRTQPCFRQIDCPHAGVAREGIREGDGMKNIFHGPRVKVLCTKVMPRCDQEVGVLPVICWVTTEMTIWAMPGSDASSNTLTHNVHNANRKLRV